MKKLWKRFAAGFFSLIIVAGCFVSVRAYADDVSWPAMPEIESQCAIVMEADTGTVLYEKNADEQHYPASITKIMTTLLALENCSLDETVTFSEDAVFNNEGNSSHIARDVDEQLTLEQCLYAVMLESANECAYAVAEHVGGGDYQAFIDRMNERAKELGCTGTNFNNANGLPDEAHVTTCRDMALIAQEAIKLDEFRKIIGTTEYTIPPTNKHPEEMELYNHHRMISAHKGNQYLYDYCIGGKTGYTVEAGNTLVTYAEKDGMLLICVIMQSSTDYEDTRSLFDLCFSDFRLWNVAENETRYLDFGEVGGSPGSSRQTDGTGAEAKSDTFAELDPEAEIVLPAGADFDDTEVELSYDDVSDEVLGTLIYTYDGREVGTADVLSAGEEEKIPFAEEEAQRKEKKKEASTVKQGEDGVEGGSGHSEDESRAERAVKLIENDAASVRDYGLDLARHLTFWEELETRQWVEVIVVLAIIIFIIVIVCRRARKAIRRRRRNKEIQRGRERERRRRR